jgi:hypothetical protein
MKKSGEEFQGLSCGSNESELYEPTGMRLIVKSERTMGFLKGAALLWVALFLFIAAGSRVMASDAV